MWRQDGPHSCRGTGAVHGVKEMRTLDSAQVENGTCIHHSFFGGVVMDDTTMQLLWHYTFISVTCVLDVHLETSQ